MWSKYLECSQFLLVFYISGHLSSPVLSFCCRWWWCSNLEEFHRRQTWTGYSMASSLQSPNFNKRQRLWPGRELGTTDWFTHGIRRCQTHPIVGHSARNQTSGKCVWKTLIHDADHVNVTQPKTHRFQQVCVRLVPMQSSSGYQNAFTSLAPAWW